MPRMCPVTTFRPDTSFPYLKIARELGVPYGEVIRTVENILSLPDYNHLVLWERAVCAAFLKESYRRKLESDQAIFAASIPR